MKHNSTPNSYKLPVFWYKVSIVLLLTLLFVLSYFVFHGEKSKGGSLGKDAYYLNPSLAILEKENLIVDFQDLREKLQTYENRDDYLISVYFEYFPTGANIAVNKDEKIWPASLIKIPVAMAAMKKVQDKKWNLENELVILDQDKDSEFGDLYKKPTGTILPIKDFLEHSLIQSDNTAHFVLLRNLEGDELEDVFVHLGMDDVIDALKKSPTKNAELDNRITAKRYSIFFRSLYNATYLDQKHSELFLDILSHAPHEYLSNGIPSSTVFVHKTGVRVDEKVMADSGIVYAPGRPYMLTVMIAQKDKKKPLKDKEIQELFKEIGSEVFDYVIHAH